MSAGSEVVHGGQPGEGATRGAAKHDVAGALAFLVMRSARNRVRSQLARLKNVRYVLGMIFLIAYFTMILRPDRIFRVPPHAADGAPTG